MSEPTFVVVGAEAIERRLGEAWRRYDSLVTQQEAAGSEWDRCAEAIGIVVAQIRDLERRVGVPVDDLGKTGQDRPL